MLELAQWWTCNLDTEIHVVGHDPSNSAWRHLLMQWEWKTWEQKTSLETSNPYKNSSWHTTRHTSLASPFTTSIAAMSASFAVLGNGHPFHNVGHHLQQREAPAAVLGDHTCQETWQLRRDLVLGNGEEVEGGGHVEDQFFEL